MAEADKNDKKVRPDFRSLATFWPYARAQKRRIAFALVALVVASLATLALPLAVRRVIEVGFAGGERQLANSYFILAACWPPASWPKPARCWPATPSARQWATG